MSFKILFITFGKGSGDLVNAVSIFKGLKRAGVECDFTAATNNEFAFLAESYFKHDVIEAESRMLFRNDRETQLYRIIQKTKPDILIVLGIWVPVLPYIRELDCYKVFLTRYIDPRWFTLPLPDGRKIPFNRDDYDLCLSFEPGFLPDGFDKIEPLVVCNPEELVSREEARTALGAQTGKKLCVISQNGYPGELEALQEQFLSPSDYETVVLSNRKNDGIFPLCRYAKGIDWWVTGAGFNAFYESRFFNIPSQFTSFQRNAEDTRWRIQHNSHYSFQTNGADQFAQIIRQLIN